MRSTRTGRRWTRLLVPLGAGLGLVLLTACSGSNSGASSAAGSGSRVIVPVAQRPEPLTLSGDTLDGKTLNLASLRGKPVVLNIWGSWCAPCRKEAPDLVTAASQLTGKATFVGIDTRDDVALAQAFQRRFKVTYPSLIDHGDLLLALRGSVPAQVPPVTLVLDEQGRIAARFVGPITTITLLDLIDDVSKSS